MGSMWLGTPRAQKMWERFTLQKTWTRSVLADADKGKAKLSRRRMATRDEVQRRAGTRQAQQ